MSASVTSSLHIVSPTRGGGYTVNIRSGHEFFTDEEGSSNEMFTCIVDAINAATFYVFAGTSDTHFEARLVEMKNVAYVLCKKSESHAIEESGPTAVSMEFTFSNVAPVMIKCPSIGEAVSDVSGFIDQTLEKCKRIGKVLTFSNGEETIIVNRRFLISVNVKELC